MRAYQDRWESGTDIDLRTGNKTTSSPLRPATRDVLEKPPRRTIRRSTRERAQRLNLPLWSRVSGGIIKAGV
jgi:hypothetical protein